MQEFEAYNLLKIDKEAPLFKLPAYNPLKDEDTEVSLESYKWRWVVLFFYPRDFTFVCPTELRDMADAKESFEKMWVDVLTISTDSVYSHRAWVQSEKLMENFPYTMLSDKLLEVSDVYNLLDEESGMAGRWTFIIDPDGFVKWIEITSGPLGRNSDELIRKIQALEFMRSNPWTACPAKWAVWDKTLNPSIKISGHVYEELNK